MEQAYDVKTASNVDYTDWALAVGGTDTYGASFSPNPPNLYVSLTDPSGRRGEGWAYDVHTWDEDYAITEINNGIGFVLTTGAWNEYTGSYDIFVMRVDYSDAMNPVWVKWFGGFGRDGGTDVIEKKTGSFADQIMVTGIYEHEDGDEDAFLIILDATTGNWLDGRRYHNANSNERIMGMAQGPISEPSFDEALFLVGSSNANDPVNKDMDIWYVAIDLNSIYAPLLASNLYEVGSGNFNDYGNNIHVNRDIVNGNSVWFVTIAGETHMPDNPNFNRADAAVLRLDLAGGTSVPNSWIHRYNIPYQVGDDSWDAAYDLVPSAYDFNNVVVVGQSNNSLDPNGSGFAMELDETGTPQATRLYGRTGYDTFRGADSYEDGMSREGYYFAGTTLSAGNGGGDHWIVLADPALNSGINKSTCNDCATPAPATHIAGGTSVPFSPVWAPIQILAGPTPMPSQGGDVLAICTPQSCKQGALPGASESESTELPAAPSQFSLMTLSPNPVQIGTDVLVSLQGEIHESAVLTVHDLAGREIMKFSGPQALSSKLISIPTKGLVAGSYSISIVNGNVIQRQALVIID